MSHFSRRDVSSDKNAIRRMPKHDFTHAGALDYGRGHNDRRDTEVFIDHASQARPGLKVFPDRLYVVTAISNPVNYRMRPELYRAFEKHMAESGVQLITVEVAHGDRDFEVTEASDPFDLQLRSNYLQEIWLKERALQLGIQHLSRLDPNWKYVAWIDADIHFQRNDWAQETMHALQSYHIIQPWQNAYDMGPDHTIMQTHQSFGYSYVTHQPLSKANSGYEYYGYDGGGIKGAHWHPGYAWAARREFIDTVGGLFDQSILGSGDDLMAKAIVGRIEDAFPAAVSDGFKRQARLWAARAEGLYRNFGFLQGSILHGYHGAKSNRRYRERWSYLTEGKQCPAYNVHAENTLKFDPETDLIQDHQGLYRIPEHKWTLRDGIREYFRMRQEDAGNLW